VFNRTRVVGVVSLAAPSMAHGGAPPRLLLRASGEEEGVGRGTEWRRLGARGGVPTGLCRSAGRPRPRGRRTAATWPALGGARRARPRVGEGEGELGRVAERAEREAGRPSSAYPLSPFFEFLFLIILPNSF